MAPTSPPAICRVASQRSAGIAVLRRCCRQGRTYAAPSLSAALARRHHRCSSIIARALNHLSTGCELASFAPLRIGFF